MALLSSRLQQLADIAQLVGDELSVMTVRLIKTDLTDEQLLDLTTVTDPANEADFGGYAAFTAQEFNDPVMNPDGEFELGSPNFAFIANGVGPANTIYAVVVLEDADASVLFAERFPTPIDVVSFGDSVSFVLRWNYPVPEGGALNLL